MASDKQEQNAIYERFCEELTSISKEEILKRLYEKTILCEENERIMENLMDGIFISDGNGYALQANASYERLVGIDRKDLMGMHLRDFVDNGYISNSCALRAIKEKRPITEESVFLKTGKRCLITCNPILADDGSVSLTVANLGDLTELYKLKEEVAVQEQTVVRYREELELIRTQLKGEKK